MKEYISYKVNLDDFKCLIIKNSGYCHQSNNIILLMAQKTSFTFIGLCNKKAFYDEKKDFLYKNIMLL